MVLRADYPANQFPWQANVIPISGLPGDLPAAVDEGSGLTDCRTGHQIVVLVAPGTSGLGDAIFVTRLAELTTAS